MTLAEMRADAAAKAMVKLKFEVILGLETVIAGTPTGILRDKLTEANILLQTIYEKRDTPEDINIGVSF